MDDALQYIARGIFTTSSTATGFAGWLADLTPRLQRAAELLRAPLVGSDAAPRGEEPTRELLDGLEVDGRYGDSDPNAPPRWYWLYRGAPLYDEDGSGAFTVREAVALIERRVRASRPGAEATSEEDRRDAARWRAFAAHAYVASAGVHHDYYLTGGDFLREAPADGFSPASFADALIAARSSSGSPAPEEGR